MNARRTGERLPNGKWRGAAGVAVLVLVGACVEGRDPGPATPRATAERPASSAIEPAAPTPRPTPTASEPASEPATNPRNDDAPMIRRTVVVNVVDGDTFDLGDGTRVRLAIVDTPETHSGSEPCGREATAFTTDFVRGETVRLYRPQDAPLTDRNGRLLAEVVRDRDGRSLNVALVAAGLGSVDQRFTDEDPDLAARARAAAADAAQPSCRTSSPSPAAAAAPPPATAAGGNGCHPSYPDVCIAATPPDLDCGEISHRRFRVVHDVADADPHGFDRDGDGLGCEG